MARGVRDDAQFQRKSGTPITFIFSLPFIGWGAAIESFKMKGWLTGCI
jgi:hypothetical protein